jgi:hypothetical protein
MEQAGALESLTLGRHGQDLHEKGIVKEPARSTNLVRIYLIQCDMTSNNRI